MTRKVRVTLRNPSIKMIDKISALNSQSGVSIIKCSDFRLSLYVIVYKASILIEWITVMSMKDPFHK